jgi:hypothetical protein
MPRAARATSIVLLGYVRGLSAGEADSRTLLALMLLRKRAGRTAPGHTPRVIVELRDADNVDLARQSGADEYIVSDAIAGRFMAQLAEQPERRLVFLALYASAGPSLRLVTAEDLALVGTVSFGDVVIKQPRRPGCWRSAGGRHRRRVQPPSSARRCRRCSISPPPTRSSSSPEPVLRLGAAQPASASAVSTTKRSPASSALPMTNSVEVPLE